MLQKKTDFFFPENMSTHHGFKENILYRRDKKIPRFGKMRLEILPVQLTKILHFLDLCINRAFKGHMRHH